jgi:ATP-dependent Clp protease ATP-binding subunit ClpA
MGGIVAGTMLRGMFEERIKESSMRSRNAIT